MSEAPSFPKARISELAEDEDVLSLRTPSCWFEEEDVDPPLYYVMDSCSICMDLLVADTTCALKCGHTFHIDCLSEHVRSKSNDAAAAVEAELEQFMTPGFDIQELRAQQRIRQCPRCGYGPVINTNCNDMRSHDSLRGNGSSRTTNSCGNCGFYSDTWADWKVWHPDQPWTFAKCPCCKGSCVLSQRSISLVRAQFHSASASLDEYPEKLFTSMTIAANLAALLAMQDTDCLHDGTGGEDNGTSLKEAGHTLRKQDILARVNHLWFDPEHLHNLVSRILRKPLQRLSCFLHNKGLRELLEKGTSYKPGIFPLTCQNALVGARVCRGPNWRGGMEDGYGAGTVRCVHAKEAGAVVEVEWDTHCVGCYSAGLLSRFELACVCSADFTNKEDWARTLKREICEPVVSSIRSYESDKRFDALIAMLNGLWEKMRNAAMLLCCVQDELPDSIIRKLGKPWLAQSFVRRDLGRLESPFSLQPRKLHQKLLDARLGLLWRLGFTWSHTRLLSSRFPETSPATSLEMEESTRSQSLVSFMETFPWGRHPQWWKTVPLLDRLVEDLLSQMPTQSVPLGSSDMLPSVLLPTATRPSLQNPWMMPGAMPWPYPHMGPPWMTPYPMLDPLGPWWMNGQVGGFGQPIGFQEFGYGRQYVEDDRESVAEENWENVAEEDWE